MKKISEAEVKEIMDELEWAGILTSSGIHLSKGKDGTIYIVNNSDMRLTMNAIKTTNELIATFIEKKEYKKAKSAAEAEYAILIWLVAGTGSFDTENPKHLKRVVEVLSIFPFRIKERFEELGYFKREEQTGGRI